jgi:hypothetical protein
VRFMVEDNAASSDLSRRLWESLGYDVVVASSDEEAIRFFGAQPMSRSSSRAGPTRGPSGAEQPKPCARSDNARSYLPGATGSFDTPPKFLIEKAGRGFCFRGLWGFRTH